MTSFSVVMCTKCSFLWCIKINDNSPLTEQYYWQLHVYSALYLSHFFKAFSNCRLFALVCYFNGCLQQTQKCHRELIDINDIAENPFNILQQRFTTRFRYCQCKILNVAFLCLSLFSPRKGDQRGGRGRNLTIIASLRILTLYLFLSRVGCLLVHHQQIRKPGGKEAEVTRLHLDKAFSKENEICIHVYCLRAIFRSQTCHFTILCHFHIFCPCFWWFGKGQC